MILIIVILNYLVLYQFLGTRYHIAHTHLAPGMYFVTGNR